MKNQKGFTLIELIVVIAIIAILSGIVLLSVPKYFATGKDANIKGNLSVLITDGEAFYDSNGNSYNAGTDATNFCKSGAVNNAWSQIPVEPTGEKNCNASSTAWAACAREFTSTSDYYCVDSTGKEKISSSACLSSTTCP